MRKYIITNIIGRQILDSRGNPTVEVDVVVDNNFLGRASVPSGASTGVFEALELRDNDKSKYNGKSVEIAVNNVNTIIKENLIGRSAENQEEIDRLLNKLDGTEYKSNLGANAILGVSLAVIKALSNAKKLPLYKLLGEEKSVTLPVPMMNVINGGKHADNNLNIQEFMIVPVGAKTFKQAVQMCSEVFHTLKNILKENGFATSVGDEGGFAPNFSNDEQALFYIVEAIKKAGYKENVDFKLALDVAASEMLNEANKINEKGKYYFWKTKQLFSQDELISFYENLIKKYPIISIEDGMGEEDFEGWLKLTNKLKNKIQLVGDDLFVTNKQKLSYGIKNNIANSILIKVNQIGSLSETIETINLAKQHGYATIISHRSGETEDVTISDLAVAFNMGQIKSGAPSRTDRVAKYNQLIRIEEELGDKALYLGIKTFDYLYKI